MNIQYSKKKQELRRDPVLETLFKIKEVLTKNSTVFTGALVLLLFIGGAILVFNRAKESSIRKAQDLFGNAVLEYTSKDLDQAIIGFGDAANNYSHTPQGVMSAYMLGSIYYEQQNYAEAANWFERAVSSKSSSGFVSGKALVGLAASLEAQDKNSEAMQYYERALRDSKIEFKHPSVRWKLAMLSSSTNKARSRELCVEIISDTSAVEYHQRAKNLLASINAGA